MSAAPESLRIAYVTDQPLPLNATDTLQIAAMVSALGEVGADITLWMPRLWRRPEVSAEQLARHYQVDCTFRTRSISGPYPTIRGLDKLALAHLAARRCAAPQAELLYTRNLPVVLAALRRRQLPVFYETYRPWPDQSPSKRALFRRLTRRSELAGLVLHSELAARSYERVGFPRDKLLVAHNGVDRSLLASPVTRREARARLGLDPAGTWVVYAGHVTPAKGLDLVLDMAEQLPHVCFALVGSAGDGPIERRAQKLGHVRVVPWQPKDQLTLWLQAADVLVIPPSSKPLQRVGNTVLPIKTFQYLAAARAILAPDIPDLREVLTDGVNARLVQPDHVAAAVPALQDLLSDPALAERLAQGARQSVTSSTWTARAHTVTRFIRDRLAAS